MNRVPVRTAPVSRIIGSPHFWIVVAMFAVGVIFHYPQQILATSLPSLLSIAGLSRHAMERIFFLLPITYTGFIFGMRAGLASLAVALIIMLPRVFWVSLYPSDALLETCSVLIIGGLVNVWFEGYRKERERRQQALLRLEAAQQELQSHIQVIKENEKRTDALYGVSTIASQSLELQDVLNAAAEKVMEVMDVEVALVFLLDEAAQELVLEVYRGVSEEFAAEVKGLEVGEGLNGRVAQTGEPLVVEDVSHDPRLTREVVKREKLQAGLIVPLKSKGKVLGTLSVFTHRSRQFLAEEVELLSHIAEHIGVAVENARLYQRERMMAEELRLSEKEYRELFENASDAMWVHDMKGNVVDGNKAFEKLTGYALEEWAGINIRKFLTDEFLDVAREVRRKLLNGEDIAQPYEQRLMRKDGTTRIMEMTTSPVLADGEVRGFQHIARDITEEKRMQENLRFYLQQVTRAQEEERRRIARELHDDTAQDLVVLSRRLDSLISSVDRLSPQDATLLAELRQQTDGILEGVRRFSQDLRPSVLDDLGLLPALEWLTSDLSQHFGIDMDVEVVGSVRRFPPEAELVMFRITQEALRNVWKHSEASRAWVTAEFGDDKTVLTIKDNGKGFELPERIGDLASVGKLGLAGMQERAQLVGGKLTLQSEPGKGTTVIIEAPI